MKYILPSLLLLINLLFILQISSQPIPDRNLILSEEGIKYKAYGLKEDGHQKSLAINTNSSSIFLTIGTVILDLSQFLGYSPEGYEMRCDLYSHLPLSTIYSCNLQVDSNNSEVRSWKTTDSKLMEALQRGPYLGYQSKIFDYFIEVNNNVKVQFLAAKNSEIVLNFDRNQYLGSPYNYQILVENVENGKAFALPLQDKTIKVNEELEKKLTPFSVKRNLLFLNLSIIVLPQEFIEKETGAIEEIYSSNNLYVLVRKNRKLSLQFVLLKPSETAQVCLTRSYEDMLNKKNCLKSVLKSPQSHYFIGEIENESVVYYATLYDDEKKKWRGTNQIHKFDYRAIGSDLSYLNEQEIIDWISFDHSFDCMKRSFDGIDFHKFSGVPEYDCELKSTGLCYFGMTRERFFRRDHCGCKNNQHPWLELYVRGQRIYFKPLRMVNKENYEL